MTLNLRSEYNRKKATHNLNTRTEAATFSTQNSAFNPLPPVTQSSPSPELSPPGAQDVHGPVGAAQRAMESGYIRSPLPPPRRSNKNTQKKRNQQLRTRARWPSVRLFLIPEEEGKQQSRL